MKIKLSNISMIKSGYSLRERLELLFDTDSTRIILPKDILENNKINFDGVSAIKMQNPDKFLLTQGEVLLQSRGRFMAVVYNQPVNKKFIASSLLLRIIVKSPDFLPEYIALFLNSQIGQAELNRLASTSAIKSIVKSELGRLEIPILPMDKQKKLIKYSESFNEWCDLNKKQVLLQTDIFNNVINKIIGENNG